MLYDAVQAARKLLKENIEQTRDGTCVIYNLVTGRDTATRLTVQKEEPVNQDPIPCHLSYSNNQTAVEQNGASDLQQNITLYMQPDIEVKPGSKITVTQNGRTEDYQRSGVPQVYASHQEIALELWKGWA